jgi:polyhydroxyalkanoate synthesis repressor PhaR
MARAHQSETRIIKKYPNRRLYDTQRSSYITIGDVRTLVLEGVPFKAIDAQSEEDITRSLLIQIITEDESGREATFTTEMLAQFIRLSHDAAQPTFARYLDQTMQLFVEQQRLVGQHLQEALGGQPLAEISQRNVELWQAFQESLRRATGLGSPPENPAPGNERSK